MMRFMCVLVAHFGFVDAYLRNSNHRGSMGAAGELFNSAPASGGHSTYYVGSAGSCSMDAYLPPWVAQGGANGKLWPVALNLPEYGNGATCGMCVAAVGTGTGSGGDPLSTKTIRYGIVVDNCPDKQCTKGSIDWRDSRQLSGSFGTKYYPVQCPTGNAPLAYQFQGSNQWYIKMAVRHARAPVAAVSIDLNGDGKWFPMTVTPKDYYWTYQYPGGNEGTVRIGNKFRLKITSALGDTVVEPAVKPNFAGTDIPDQLVVGTVQFPLNAAYRQAYSANNPLPTKAGAMSLV